MAHPLERELLAHAHSLRALARDLVGESMADDLVQDAAVELLRAPPSQPERLGGWLATIVRRLAGKHRRAEGRRRRREQAAARPEPVPPDRTVDDRDAFARLSRAVLALPEPYQSTIFERYLRDRTPTEIAAARDERVRTVKTRLQRGLHLLREQLDRDDRDWRGAFACAFGIDRLLPASAAALTGVALMGTGTKLLCAGAAVATLVAGTWLVWPATPGAQPDASAREHGAAIAATAAGAATSDNDRAPEPDAAPTRSAVAPAAPAEAVLRGVCVDTAGAPLANVAVALQGSVNDARMEAWLREHPRPQDLDLQMVTGADGAFALRELPPQPFQIRLELARNGLASATVLWDGIAPGAQLDLGRIELARGARVRGHVTDAEGMPIARTQVGFVAVDARPYQVGTAAGGALVVNNRGWSRTDVNGYFEPTPSLRAGIYRVEVGTLAPLHPQLVVIDGSSDPLDVEIVLPVPAAADTIAGVVVDATGAPLADATLTMEVLERRQRSWRQASCTDDGHFSIARPAQGVADAVPLRVHMQGFDRRETEPIAWGRVDVRIVLERSLAIELVAVAADDDTPIEDYRVRVDPEPELGRLTDGNPVTANGHHPVGRTTLVGLDRGNHHISLVPAGDTFGTVALQALRVGDACPRTVTVRVPRLGLRTLQLAFADGRPAAGSTVRLADPCGAPRPPSLPPGTLEQLVRGGARGLLLQTVASDDRGEATLRGPIGVGLELEILGPLHEPVRLCDVSLAATEPLRVIVQTGAVVRGVLRPEGALRGLRELAGLPAEGPLDQQERRRLPFVTLRRDNGGDPEFLPPRGHPDLAFADDGTFELTGVPAGTWDVVIAPGRARSGGWIRTEVRAGSVVVAAGATTTIKVDVAFLLPGELEGLVLHNGVPLRNATAMVVAAPNARNGISSETIATDAEGRFRSRFCVGEYRVAMQVPNARATGWGDDMLFASERVVVQAGTSVAQTFHVMTGTVRCRVLDADGQPMRGARLVLVDRNGAMQQKLPPTDTDGRTQTIAVVQPQVVALATGSIDAPHLQQLREVLPNAGDTLEVELRLPDSRR